MSGAIAPTIAGPPTAIQVATDLLAMIAALSGVATDYNIGSQIRTQAEAIGAVAEQQGVGASALVLQGMAYGAMYVLGITPRGAVPATGVVTFATSFPVSAAPAIGQTLSVPAGTLVQTAGGIVFSTTVSGLFASGAASLNLPVIATSGGSAGNVQASGITGQSLTNLGYPLFVSNGAPTAGGSPAETLSQTLARFTAAAAALGLCSPYAIANAVIGVSVSGTGETVQYSTVYEPWIAAGTGVGSGTAGFTVFVDNGTGSASVDLLAAVSSWITGSIPARRSGYRPAGVPFAVSAVVPVGATVAVSGILLPGFLSQQAAEGAAIDNIVAYFGGLGFNVPAEQPQVGANAANAALGLLSSLTVQLYYAGAPSVPVDTVAAAAPGNRVVLSGLSVDLEPGT